jgi:heptosyltransferase I
MPLVFEEPPESLCIIRLSAIGDCVHTLSVVRSIQAAWPRTRITWIIGKTEYALFEGAYGIEFIIFDKSKGWRALMDVRRQLRGRHFPLLLHMHASMRANLVSLLVHARKRIGFDRPRARDRQWLFTNHKIPALPQQHVMDGLFGFANELGIERGEGVWDLPLADADRDYAGSMASANQPVCVISPCSSERFRNFRNWSRENYIAVTRYMQSTHNAQVILTGGPTDLEHEYGRAITADTDTSVLNLIGQTSLKQLAALLERADLLICPDSGPAHIANAVGTPVIGLYATSNRYRTGPYDSQHLVVDAYPEAVQRELGQPVEALRWGQRVRAPDAMDLIGVDDVYAKVDEVLGALQEQR